MYPVTLSVKGRRCLVVGGGWVALRKVEGLLAEGAVVTVVAREAVGPILDLEKTQAVALERREYQVGEAAAFALVFAATDDRDVNRRVSEDASAAGVWVNVADDPALCSFHLPARVRRGALQLSVASAGEAPFVVRRLRAFLERRFGPEWAAWTEAAGRFRTALRSLKLPQEEAERRYDAFFDSTVDQKSIRARVPTAEEMDLWLKAGERREPEIEASGFRPKASGLESRTTDHGLRTAGFVSLVGAGPGDAGLLTVKGQKRLHSADAIVYDRLAATALPCDLPAGVDLHSVGKEAGHHPVQQEEISTLLVRLAREGKRVARLKGGDPYVFGRGGEEAEALAAAGIPFEVVPGVTAGIAVPAYAGIPATHRREAVRLTLLTAHESKKEEGTQIRWDLLGADPHATLVGYMGVTSLPVVVERLIAAGMSPDTPAAVIERGTTSGQKTVTAPLSKLAAEVTRAGIDPPALFVIGPVVRHAAALEWFAKRPLSGRRVVIVAPAGDLGAGLESAGAELVEVPLPVTPAAKVVLGALPVTDCVLRGPGDADGLDDERDGPGWDSAKVVVWCLGRPAVERARARGWRNIHEVKAEATTVDMVARVSDFGCTNRLPP
ncbi:MAG: uroporphyrinogen-III C-methyltransferase [Deltaproteobacteria bacterium]|nr:uroporphyrinogen-III C-methyltransferase [Deltaproteobacteria bacterium]